MEGPLFLFRMKNLRHWVFLFLVWQSSFAKEVALTFDDAPLGDGVLFTGEKRTQRIIQLLKREKIQTVFFVNPVRFGSAADLSRIFSYANAGHLIANHTNSHPSLKRTSLQDYLKEIESADKLLSQFSTYTKWFRYPYLHEGDTVQVRDGVREFLSKIGYKNGYVTVDNYDYFIDDLVQKALAEKKKVNLSRACRMLSDLTLEGLEFNDSLAQKYIGQVRHVLLMHENDVEATCLGHLVRRLKSHGWKIVSPSYAFSDPLMQYEPNTLHLSQGRVAALAHVKSGVKYVSKWESTLALAAEFSRRRIVTTR